MTALLAGRRGVVEATRAVQAKRSATGRVIEHRDVASCVGSCVVR